MKYFVVLFYPWWSFRMYHLFILYLIYYNQFHEGLSIFGVSRCVRVDLFMCVGAYGEISGEWPTAFKSDSNILLLIRIGLYPCLQFFYEAKWEILLKPSQLVISCNFSLLHVKAGFWIYSQVAQYLTIIHFLDEGAVLRNGWMAREEAKWT